MSSFIAQLLLAINLTCGVVLLGLFVGVTLGVLLCTLPVRSPAGLRAAISDGNSWFWSSFLALTVTVWYVTWWFCVNVLLPFLLRWGYPLWVALRLVIDGILTNKIGDTFPPALWGIVEQWQWGWSLAPAPPEVSIDASIDVPAPVTATVPIDGPVAPSFPVGEGASPWHGPSFKPFSPLFEFHKYSFEPPRLLYGINKPLSVVPIRELPIPEGYECSGVNYKGIQFALVRNYGHDVWLHTLDCHEQLFAPRMAAAAPQGYEARYQLCLSIVQEEMQRYPDRLHVIWSRGLYGPPVSPEQLDGAVELLRGVKHLQLGWSLGLYPPYYPK